MAKTPNAAIGLDLGRSFVKAVAMQRRGNRLSITDYVIMDVPAPPETVDQHTSLIRSVAASLPAGIRSWGVSVATSDAIIRIAEQPITPTEILRDAIRLNSVALLNADLSKHVIDCAPAAPIPKTSVAPGTKINYLVGGVPRAQVQTLNETFGKAKLTLEAIQLSPIATYNAFEWADPDTFSKEAFLLVDVGYIASTIAVGAKQELILVRTLEYGAKTLADALLNAGAPDVDTAFESLEMGDENLTQVVRFSLKELSREISSSIGFFEGRREESIGRVLVSGLAAGSQAILQSLAEDLHMPVLAWDPFARCEIGLPEPKRSAFRRELVTLNAAAGVAMQVLKGK